MVDVGWSKTYMGSFPGVFPTPFMASIHPGLAVFPSRYSAILLLLILLCVKGFFLCGQIVVIPVRVLRILVSR